MGWKNNINKCLCPRKKKKTLFYKINCPLDLICFFEGLHRGTRQQLIDILAGPIFVHGEIIGGEIRARRARRVESKRIIRCVIFRLKIKLF